jgi:hypothetical protein
VTCVTVISSDGITADGLTVIVASGDAEVKLLNVVLGEDVFVAAEGTTVFVVLVLLFTVAWVGVGLGAGVGVAVGTDDGLGVGVAVVIVCG